MTDPGTTAASAHRLPKQTQRYGLDLHLWQPEEAAALHAVIPANVDHLRPYMAWIALEPQTLDQRRELLETWAADWASGGDLTVGIWRAGQLVGSGGLHRRPGPGGLEIGYWVARDHLNQGIATAASRALTDLAFTVPGIERVQITHDVNNLASARIPATLGFRRLPDRPSCIAQGPAGTGIEGLWQVTKDEWRVH
ncbi:GNAT family N-acetyltransferase [Nakamurella antarctica]|nr:GNAT family N-acetyltransferase [Nakamurella antarctica]